MASASQDARNPLRGMKSRISKEIGNDDKKLFRELGLTDAEIQNIEHENYRNVCEFRYQLLNKWQQNRGNEATEEELSSALRKIERNDLADKLQSEIKQRKPQSEDAENELEKRLKELYKEHIQLPQLQWMKKNLPLDELFVELETLEIDKTNETNGGKIELKEIFKKSKTAKTPRRILIEGSPGYGKTTLALKILSDWSKGETYVQQFKAAFLFELRHFSKYNSIEEALKEECNELGVDDEKVIKYIEQNQEKILLIFDGFDELRDTEKESLTPLINKQKYPNACVIFTCRRGWYKEFSTNRNKNSGLAKKLVETSEFWNKRILIKGITKIKREEFIKKYFKTNDEILNKLFWETKLDLYECPLFLILLASVIKTHEDFKDVQSKTSLYKLFFNSIFRNGLIREGKLSDDIEIDIFHPIPPESTQEFIRHFASFGKLALQHLIDDDLTFAEHEVLNCVDNQTYFLNLGILTKCSTFTFRDREEFHQPIHKTFLEFSAAFHLFHLSNTSENHKEFKDQISIYVESKMNLHFECPFFQFVAGLLNSKASHLLEALSPYAAYFPIDGLRIREILSEIKEIKEIIPHLVHFVQPALDLLTSHQPDRFSDILLKTLKQICQRFNENKSIKMMIMNGNIALDIVKLSLDDPLVVEDIYFEPLQVKEDMEIPDCRNPIIRCKNLYCAAYEICDSQKLRLFFPLFETENISFYFKSEFENYGQPCILDNLRNEEQISFKISSLCVDQRSLSYCLIDLIREGRVNNFFPFWNYELSQGSIYELMEATTSGSMEEFDLRFHSFDKPAFSPKNTFLPLEENGREFYDCVPDMQNVVSKHLRTVEELVFDNRYGNRECVLRSQATFIKSCTKLRSLSCSIEVVKSLIDERWPGLKHLLELHLIGYFPLLDDYSQFENLTTCTVYLNQLKDDNFVITNLTTLASRPKLTAIKFLIWNDFLLTALFRHWLTLRTPTKLDGSENSQVLQVHLKELNMVVLIDRYCDISKLPNKAFKECFPLVRQLLKTKQVEKFCFTHDSYQEIALHPSLFPITDNFHVFNDFVNFQKARDFKRFCNEGFIPTRYSVIYRQVPDKSCCSTNEMQRNSCLIT